MDPLRSQCTDAQMEKLFLVMERIRQLDDKMPAQVTACLLWIASHSRGHKTAMEDRLKISVASGSRNTDWLSDWHRLGKPGLGLVCKSQDPSNRRRAQLELTPKGELLIEDLRQILYGKHQDQDLDSRT